MITLKKEKLNKPLKILSSIILLFLLIFYINSSTVNDSKDLFKKSFERFEIGDYLGSKKDLNAAIDKYNDVLLKPLFKPFFGKSYERYIEFSLYLHTEVNKTSNDSLALVDYSRLFDHTKKDSLLLKRAPLYISIGENEKALNDYSNFYDKKEINLQEESIDKFKNLNFHATYILSQKLKDNNIKNYYGYALNAISKIFAYPHTIDTADFKIAYLHMNKPKESSLVINRFVEIFNDITSNPISIQNLINYEKKISDLYDLDVNEQYEKLLINTIYYTLSKLYISKEDPANALRLIKKIDLNVVNQYFNPKIFAIKYYENLLTKRISEIERIRLENERREAERIERERIETAERMERDRVARANSIAIERRRNKINSLRIGQDYGGGTIYSIDKNNFKVKVFIKFRVGNLNYFQARDKCLSSGNWRIVSSSESKQIFKQRYSLEINGMNWSWWTSTAKNSTNNYIYSFKPVAGREGLIGYGEKSRSTPSIYYDDGPSYSRRDYKGSAYMNTCFCSATYTVR